MNIKIILTTLAIQITFLNLKSQNVEIKSIQKTISTTLENNKQNVDDNRFVYFILTVIKNKKGELLDIFYLKSSLFKEDDKLKDAIKKIKLNWKINPTTYTTIYIPFIEVYPENDELGNEQNNIQEATTFTKLIDNIVKKKDIIVAKPYYNVIIGEPKQKK